MWDKPNAEYFKHSVLVGIAWMAAGIVFASAQFFLRYRAFESAAKHWRWAHHAAVGLSLGVLRHRHMERGERGARVDPLGDLARRSANTP
jgi:hypothetical protein